MIPENTPAPVAHTDWRKLAQTGARDVGGCALRQLSPVRGDWRTTTSGAAIDPPLTGAGPPQEGESAERIYADWLNENRRQRRAWLYRHDPLWRLTKLKANWELRERKRRAGLANRRVQGKRVWLSAHDHHSSGKGGE